MSTEHSESALQTAADSMRTQWKAVVGVVVVIAFSIGGYLWYVSNESERNIEASTQLSRVRMTFDMGDFSKALSGDSIPPVGADSVMGLLEISEQYSGTDAGSVAALMAGNALLNLGRAPEAVEQFERAQSSDAQIVEIGALQGLASCKEASGSFADAATLYEQAGAQGAKSGLEDRCYYHAALCFEKTGNKEKAIDLYTMVVKKFEMSEVAASARAGLARLGMAID